MTTVCHGTTTWLDIFIAENPQLYQTLQKQINTTHSSELNDKDRTIQSLLSSKKDIENIKQLKEQLSDALILTCPHGCGFKFDDHDACSALTCDQCNGHFCGVCFKTFESSRDTHQHLTDTHGGYYQKKLFDQYKQRHHDRVINTVLRDQPDRVKSIIITELGLTPDLKSNHVVEEFMDDCRTKLKDFIDKTKEH